MNILWNILKLIGDEMGGFDIFFCNKFAEIKSFPIKNSCICISFFHGSQGFDVCCCLLFKVSLLSRDTPREGYQTECE